MQRTKTLALSAAAFGAAATVAAFIAPFEGIKYVAYQDGGGVWTICRGHTKDVYPGMKATPEQCDKFFLEDILAAQAVYDTRVKFQHHPNVKAASTDFIFNTGAGNFASSTLLRKLNAGDRSGACYQFPRWHYSAGKDCYLKSSNCPGIPPRREAEKRLCMDNQIYRSFIVTDAGIVEGVP